MPLYFFHVRSAAGLEADDLGVYFGGLAEAIADARKARAEMMVDEAIEMKRLDGSGIIEIADETGQVLATVPFVDS